MYIINSKNQMFINKTLAMLYDEAHQRQSQQEQPKENECSKSQLNDQSIKNSHHLSQSVSLHQNAGTLNRGCNCKKSKCLKMYCDCYLSGNRCGESCKCLNCQNATVFDSSGNRVILQPDADSRKGKNQNRGCNCKKSQCLKKYCQCFNSGLACNSLCKCQQCKNTVVGDTSEPQHSIDLVQNNFSTKKVKNKQINENIQYLLNQVNQLHQQSMLQFLHYLLS